MCYRGKERREPVGAGNCKRSSQVVKGKDIWYTVELGEEKGEEKRGIQDKTE